MKKLLSVIAIVLSLALCLCACGETVTPPDETSPETEEVESLNLDEVYEKIIAAQSETGMEELALYKEEDTEIIEGYYEGLGNIELNQEVCYMAFVTGSATEIMLVEVASLDDVAKVQEIFNNRIDVNPDDLCDPGIAETWQNNAVVQVSGNYVAMVVLPDGYVIPENVFEF